MAKYIHKRLIDCDHFYTELLPVSSTDTVLEVGAASGKCTVKLSKIAKTVVAIEPCPIYQNVIKEKINKHNLDNVILINKGVWNTKTRLKMIIDGHGSSIKSLSNIAEIECDTIDNIVNELRYKGLIDKISYLSMDIEGAEIEALQGANETLKTVNKIFVAGYHIRNDEQTYKWVKDYLTNRGFTVYITEEKLVIGEKT